VNFAELLDTSQVRSGQVRSGWVGSGWVGSLVHI
jgi:hypothetical protein